MTAPHTCHAQRCPVEVPPAMFMCQPHWFMVPPPLREALKGSYRPGQENDKQPSAEYLAIARAAIDAVAHKESRAAKPKPAAPRPARKPVQLALFELASPES
ncbi:hypothetical protein [Mycobacterium avium]|uniref:hypothetical protein n=1 Tax=Mycobacterium avium TaxID=1764 RepID=UPI001595BB98|nr:hypothetical protein [Mycobacterium avium]